MLEAHLSKRCRMSDDSVSELPSSAVSFSPYADPFTSASASHSQRSSVDFPYTPYLSGSFNMLRRGLWHPPMTPPMLPSGLGAEESPMFFHPPMIQHHSPMLPPDDSPQLVSSSQRCFPMRWHCPPTSTSQRLGTFYYYALIHAFINISMC